MQSKRLAAGLLAVLLCLSLLPTSALAAEGSSYYVGTEQELVELADKCALDTWSQGVTVVLTADIDLSEVEFESIPTFGGIFEGNGHTISGLDISYSGSHMGLFRYIQESGEVRNLTVRGTVAPGGTAEYVGGIAGNNSGKILRCVYSGAVEGLITVGGIVGANEQTGVIEDCRSYGTVYGEHYTGGIAGRNLGRISGSDNTAAINVTSEVPDIVLADLNLDNLISTENLSEFTDTGGIVGHSSGVVVSCTNSGTVGYEHVGYNVGGIAGRQSGYMINCANTGYVNGRKEVGGIVGQMEPYLTLDLSASSVDNLVNGLGRLHDLLDKTLLDAQGSTESITARLNVVSGSMSDASDDLSFIAGSTVDFVDDTIGEINDIGDRIGYVVDALPSIFEHFEEAGSSATASLEYLRRVNDDLALVEKMESGVYDETDHNLLSITAGTGGRLVASTLNPAAGQLVTLTVTPGAGYSLNSIGAWDADGAKLELVENADGTYSFEMPVLSGDPISDPVNAKAKNTVIRASFAPNDSYADRVVLSSTYGGYISTEQQNAAAGQTVSIAVEPNEGYELFNLTVVKNSEGYEDIAVSRMDELGTSYSFVMPANGEGVLVSASFQRKSDWAIVEDMANVINIRSAELSAAMDSARANFDALKNSLNIGSAENVPALLSDLISDLLTAGSAIGDIIDAAGQLTDALAPYVSEAAQQLNEDLGFALTFLKSAANSLTDAVAELRVAISYVAGESDIQFPVLGSEFSGKIDSLCGNLSNMADGLTALNNELANAGTVLLGDLRAVNDQFNIVMLLLVDTVQGLTDISLGSNFTDISEEEDSSTEGKVVSCSNRGVIFGDINVGGIAGGMAIEYDFDPESDVTGSSGLSSFLTKCVLKNCTNYGDIKAKKSGVGCIVGYMDLGSVVSCFGFGSASSESGNNVGGIAGQSMTAIRDSWAMCTLSGRDNVGGIVGNGTRVYDCRSLVIVESADEGAGAIVGTLNKDGDILGNVFVSDKLHGIDGISYSGAAEPVSFESLIAMDAAPSELTDMTLSFEANGKVIKAVSFEYGGSIDASEIPQVPEREGYSGSWPEFDPNNLTFSRVLCAEYISLASTLESAATSGEAELPILLVEGSYLPGAVVSTTKLEQAPLEVSSGLTPLETISASVSGNGADDKLHTVHYLIPETEGRLSKVVIYLDDGDGWKRVEYSNSGRYALFDVDGDSFSICAAEQPPSNVSVLVGAGAAVLGLGLIAAFWLRSKHRKKKTADSAV